MKLVLVISKGKQNDVCRISTESPVSDVIHFLTLLGVENWELDSKASARLYYNGPNYYVAIGPANSSEEADFLKRIRRTCLRSDGRPGKG